MAIFIKNNLQSKMQVIKIGKNAAVQFPGSRHLQTTAVLAHKLPELR